MDSLIIDTIIKRKKILFPYYPRNISKSIVSIEAYIPAVK